MAIVAVVAGAVGTVLLLSALAAGVWIVAPRLKDFGENKLAAIAGEASGETGFEGGQ